MALVKINISNCNTLDEINYKIEDIHSWVSSNTSNNTFVLSGAEEYVKNNNLPAVLIPTLKYYMRKLEVKYSD